MLENDVPSCLERVKRWKLAKTNWDQFQHLCSTRLHQSAIADADDPMPLFTSILKDIDEETIPNTSAVPKRFNKQWFSNICKDTIKERNRALDRFKREPTEVNLNVYRIARVKAEMSDCAIIMSYFNNTLHRSFGSETRFYSQFSQTSIMETCTCNG